jgi:hypothetical protein
MKVGFVLAALSAIGLLIGAGVLFLGADQAASAQHSQYKAAAGAAMQAVSFNQQIMDTLGSPLTMGEVTVQREDISFFGRSTVSLNINVTGTKGTGHASINLAKGDNKNWQVVNGNFFPSNGPPIFIRTGGR